MTKSQRMFAIIIAAAMLISGFAFGRMAETPKTTAEESKAALATSSTSSPSPESTSPATTEAASENKAFYLTDFKTGYSEGYNAGLNGQSSSVTNTARAGYNDGFKDGYADGYQALAKQQTTNASARPVVAPNRVAQQSVVYRPSGAPVRRRGSSKLKTALTIAAPAAIGAGIGAAAGGGRGAAAGALIGGGGGALYHLIKNRNRD
jgi:cytoskeletal protein RodZ